MKITLKHKVIGLALSAALLPLVVMSLFICLEKSRIRATVRERVEALIRDNTDQIARDVYAMCESTNALVQRQVDSNLCVARMILNQKGGLTFDAQKSPWTAVNQLTRAEIQVELPKAMVEGKWLGQNVNGKKRTPVVDDVRNVAGCTCTVFQRMNKQGDMLRIATNVVGRDGQRTIATYIPALNPNNTANPVVAAVLKGETYHGPALVVDTWYLTAYEPILAADRTVAGMLYVGVKRDGVTSLQEAIQSIKVGKTGYVAVYGDKGEQRGQYIVAKRGTRLEQTGVANSTARAASRSSRRSPARPCSCPRGASLTTSTIGSCRAKAREKEAGRLHLF